MPLCDFFKLDGMTRNVLEPGEMVTHITLPEDASDWSGDYQKLRQRESWDFLKRALLFSGKEMRETPIKS